MKKNIKFLAIFMLIPLLFACDKFLDLEPKDNGVRIQNEDSDSAYYKSANEVEADLAGVYSDLKNEYFELDYFVNGDAQSDDAYAGADNPANFQIDDYKIDATNSNVSRDWQYLYSTIGKANTVINNVDAISDPDLTTTRKLEIKAEASFLRAFMYFQLVQLWGDVPLQLKEVKTISAELLPEIYPILFPARNTMDEVYDQIIIDLELALTGTKVSREHKGFVTTGAVNAVLAKVYATRQPRDWNKVLTYCNAVASGPYALLPDYEMLWNNEHENSAESIFEINYEGTSTDGNWGTNMFLGFDWKKFNIPSNDLLKAFDDENDQIRKNASVTFLDVSGKWSDEHYPQTAYPFLNKYRNITSPSSQNYMFIRLADILLLKAEALNETGDVAGAAALVNQIRARVNLAATTAADQASMRLAIEKERRLELAFEGHRWFDLKRNGRAIAVINAALDHNGQNLGYQLNENRLVWPIPQAELDKNTKLVQNPGY